MVGAVGVDGADAAVIDVAMLDVVVQRTTGDGVSRRYLAYYPELSGVMGHGETIDDARRSLEDAAKDMLAFLRAHGADLSVIYHPRPHCTNSRIGA